VAHEKNSGKRHGLGVTKHGSFANPMSHKHSGGRIEHHHKLKRSSSKGMTH
jgi:hypothetical protein